jgi:putative nucleotidyltransferase with HDIG domain
VEPAAMAGRLASEFGVSGDLIGLWIGKYRESQQTGGPVHFQFRAQTALGPRWMSGIACHLGLSPEGRRRFAYVAEDITEHRLAEETIAEQIRLAEYGRDVGLALTEGGPMGRMLTRCAEAMVRRLDAAFAGIWTLDEAGAVPELQGRAGLEPQGDGHREIRDIVGLIARQRRPYMTNDMPGDPVLQDGACVSPDGMVAFAGYPLIVEEKLIGVAAMFARGALSEATLQAMLSVSNGLALGIERKRAEDQIRRLNEQLDQRLRRTKALRRIDAAITTSRDPGPALALVLEEAIGQLGVDAADILICEKAAGALKFAIGRGIPVGALGHGAIDREGLAGRVAGEGLSLYVPDLARAPVDGSRVGRLIEEGFVAYHAIPLMAEGRVKGVLECFGRAPIEPDAEWLAFAGMLAEQAAISLDNASLVEGLRRSNEELKVAYDSTIEGWARALDLRDHETEGHSRRVTEMALALARAIGLGEAELVQVRRGALLHDIGKLGVPDAILHKPAALDEDEWVVMRRHPSYAVEILGPIEFLRPALDIPHCHHERWDGTGYPRGLAGEQIPLTARIFAAVDIWDALSHDRPYRRAWPQARVREHLRSLSGTHLDPRIVDAFLGLLASADPASPA